MTKFKNGELDHYKEKDMTEYVYAIMYNWGDKKYLKLEKRLLTDDELEEVNGKLIDEKIGELVRAIYGEFDWKSVLAAEDIYRESDY